MTHKDFTDKWLGRFLNYDGVLGSQCVDLMRGYIKEVHGLNPYQAIPQTGAAKNIFYNFRDNQWFKKIPNTPTGVPEKGDLMFFKTSLWFPRYYGWDGHVGIVESADVNTMILFSQNYPTGQPCIFRKFSYKDCLGWLHRK